MYILQEVLLMGKVVHFWGKCESPLFLSSRFHGVFSEIYRARAMAILAQSARGKQGLQQAP